MRFDSTIYEDGIYDEASVYDAWLKNANERDLFKEYFEKNMDTWATKSPLSIVELGCGSGAAGIRIMGILEKAGIEYEYTGVEPYQEQINVFKQKIGDKPNVHFIQSGLEDFETDKKYDVAFAIHSLYYVPNMTEAIKKIYSFSKITVIVHHGPHGINEVHEKFREYVKEGPHIIGTYAGVATALKSEKIEFQFDTFPSEVNIKSIKEAGNETGKKLIEFFLERTDLSDDVIEDVRNYFRERLDTMRHDVGIFITKPH